jgi:hypothetical protein
LATIMGAPGDATATAASKKAARIFEPLMIAPRA